MRRMTIDVEDSGVICVRTSEFIKGEEKKRIAYHVIPENYRLDSFLQDLCWTMGNIRVSPYSKMEDFCND